MSYLTSWLVNLKPGFVISSQSTWELMSAHVVCVICRYRNWSATIRTTTLVKTSWDMRKLGAKPHASNKLVFSILHMIGNVVVRAYFCRPLHPSPLPSAMLIVFKKTQRYNVNTAPRGRGGKGRHFDQLLRSWPQRFYQGCRCKVVNILGLLFANLSNLH